MGEIEKVEGELRGEREELLRKVESLIKEDAIGEAVERVKEATKLTEELEGLKRARELEEEIIKIEKERRGVETKLEEVRKSFDVEEGDIKREIDRIWGEKRRELEKKREEVMEGIRSLVEEDKSEEAIMKVKSAGEITEEMEKKSPEVLELEGKLDEVVNKRKSEEGKLVEEITLMVAKIEGMRKEQREKKMILEVRRGLEKPEPEVVTEVQEIEKEEEIERPGEEVVTEIQEAEELKEEIEEAAEVAEGEELTKVDYLILKGVSMCYKTPKKIAKVTNVDEVVVEDRIEDLIKKGYLK
jgi:hypothetical protein